MMNKQLKFRGVRPFFLMLLLFASCTEVDGLMERDASTVSFSLPSGGLSPETAVSRAGGVNMEVGTTVRVVAYRRPSGASSPVLSAANYAGEATYKVATGSTLELCGITTDAAGTPSVDTGATPVPLKLIQGTYDFYAVTPALEVDHTGTNPTLSVRHHTDYAVSATAAKSISPGNSTVGLVTLERRCALLSISTDRTDAAIDVTKVVLGDVQLTKMPDEPMQATGTGALDATGNTNNNTLTIAAAKFGIPDAAYPWKAYGQAISLPKSTAAFNLKVNVTFNDNETVLLEAADLSMGFDAGKQYAFTIRFKERGGMELLVGVAPWTDAIGSTQIGGTKLPAQVVVGEWTDADWGTSIGGTKIPPFTPNVDAWEDLNSAINVGKDEGI